jgi:hypothetical protein
MSILDELEDYVPSADPVKKVMVTNDKRYILREGDKIDILEGFDLDELFEDADEDSEGFYIEFNYPTKYNKITAYESNYGVLLVHDDGRKAIINDDLYGHFGFKDMIIVHGHETIHILDTTDFSIHEEHTR